MTKKLLQLSLAKFISIFVFICILVTAVGPGLAVAQGPLPPVFDSTLPGLTPTPTPSVTKTPAPLLELTPTEMLTPTAEELTIIDSSSAGEGTLFRARIQLLQPNDLKRLHEWKINVLTENDGYAFVQVEQAELEKLARLGFRPDEIDSLEYLASVHNAMNKAKSLSANDLARSSSTLLSLSSVDLDEDGLTDTEEAWWCTNPLDNNSDSPMPPSSSNPSDGEEVNDILRGVKAYGPPFALWPQFTPLNPNGNCPDGDFDAVPDYAEEFMIGTSNLRESSDLDKFDDGQELFGVTYCPGTNGPCGYGILPRAEDAAFVSAILPAWVKEPGNSPFVSAFPDPEVEVVPSSISMNRVTVITTSEGTMQGTEKTYGTSSTKGTSTSVANTESWNEWQAVYNTKQATNTTALVQPIILNSSLDSLDRKYEEKMRLAKIENTANFLACPLSGPGGCANSLITLITTPFKIASEKMGEMDQITDQLMEETKSIKACTKIENRDLRQLCLAQFGIILESTNSIADYNENSQDSGGLSGTSFGIQPNQNLLLEQSVRVNYPLFSIPPLETEGHGTEKGWSQTTTKTEYEEQAISQSSTDQYTHSWSTAIAVDSSHAADLRFTYNIVNNGTEYAREVSSLTFNIYIGSNPNPAYTYVAVGATGQIAKVENLFPGDSLTYTSNPIALTLDEMRAIDEGAPIRIVMEDISFGQDQVFYLDALNGSVTVAMEDGYDDLDETVDTYLVPVWDPSDTVQDVAKRYFPVIEDADGNLLAVFTPELASNVPSSCVQDATIAPASNTMVYCKHALTGTSWWNFYLSDGLNYDGAFKDTLAAPNTTMLVRIVSDRDLDGYNDRNEIKLGTDPDDPAEHPSPNLLAGYTKSCVGNDCTLRMTFQNIGNYDAYGVEAILYTSDGLVNITNNTIGGSGRVAAGGKVVVGASDTFQYTKTVANPKEPVIVVSYNDPQGNHRFIVPAAGLVSDLNADLTSLNGLMLPDPGVDIASTSSTQANFVIFSPHTEPITDGKLFVEYIDNAGNVAHEDTFTQTFDPGPTVIPVAVDTATYPPDQYILLAFFTDSQGNILDSSARPLASFGADPSPEANLTTGNWKVGNQAVIEIDDPWNFGTVQPGTTLHASMTLGNTGLGDLRYALSGWGSGLTVTGVASGSLSPSSTRSFTLSLDTAGMTPGAFSRTLTLRTNDPYHGTITIHLTGIIGTAGQAAAYKINDFRPWDQYVYVPGPHNQNDVVSFTHTLVDDPTRMFPLYLYTQDGQTLKGVGEYGVDFSGQTAPFGVFGDGRDGVMPGSGNLDSNNGVGIAIVNSGNVGSYSVTVIDAYSGWRINPGDAVLIHQTQGSGAGCWEMNNAVSDYTGGVAVIQLMKPLICNYASGGNNHAQIMRVPQYTNCPVSGVVTPLAQWNGAWGGIFAVLCNGTMAITGQIRANGGAGSQITGNCIETGGAGLGYGFRGGNAFRSHGNSDAGCGWSTSFHAAQQGESALSSGNYSDQSNGSGGGGGPGNNSVTGSGGGGGYGTTGGTGGGSDGASVGGIGGQIVGIANLAQQMYFGNGGGGGQKWYSYAPGGGGAGGGIIYISARQLNVSGSVTANGGNGASADQAGGGGSGGSVFIRVANATLGSSAITAIGGSAGTGQAQGGAGGVGRIRIEYSTLNGTTNPSASTQQINYYNLTGNSLTSLYMPEAVTSGNYIRYSLQYGQRSSNTNGGDQLFSVRLPNRQYSSITLSALNERVAGSGSTFNFCLDIGNNGTCDYTTNNQSFSAPVRLDSTNLASALNAYITAQHSAQEYLTIPIRVNISTPADIFLFNLSSSAGNDVDLIPTNFTITPPNGNPASNIPEGSQVTLSAAVTNNGTHIAENLTVAFYNGDPANGGVLVGSTFIASLAGGATSPTQEVTWNTTGLLGDKTLYVKVDASSTVAESNETNNVASAPAVIKKKADLVITNLTVPDARQGETVIASISVKNDGEADVTGAVISLYDGTPGTGTLLNSVTVNVPKGATTSAQISFSINTVGAHTLWSKADPANLVLEADETNNTQSASMHVGWNLLTVDAGGAGDATYSTASGYGWANGTAVTTCGTGIEKSFRQVGSSETLTYKFDNLLPGRRYHLDLTFATCSGERRLDVLVDGHSVSETGTTPQPLRVTSTPQTVSLLLDPADYADGTITLAIRRSSGLSGPLVNIIDLQEVNYCYRDSGPDEAGWTAENDCGYDTTPITDGFDGWGTSPEQTMRFGENGVNYKFTTLDPLKRYNVRLTFYEGDGTGRDQSILFDGAQAQTVALSSTVQSLVVAIPPSAYADGQAILSIQRADGEAVVNEVTLEEDTRAENNRYSGSGTPSTSTPTPTPIPTLVPPQVTVNSFTATWGGSQVNILWSTTTEINNHHFNLYRSTDSFTWTQIAVKPSQFQCGNFAGASPANYYYTDTDVAYGMTYYYRLQYSGDGCGTGNAMAPMMAMAKIEPPTPTPTLPAASTLTTIAPAGSITSWDHSFMWSGVSGATWYFLEVQTPAGVELLRKWFTAVNVGCADDLNCAVTPAELTNLPNGEYKWRVQDYGAYGYGIWTAFKSFTLDASCYSLTIASDPIGSSTFHAPTQNCPGGYTSGTVVQLTALPVSGYVFQNWSGDASGNVNPLSIEMDGNKNISANLRGVSLISPAGTLTSWDHNFRWTGANEATWYFVEVQTSTGTEILRKWHTAAAAGCSGDLSCILAPAELLSLPNGDYKWRVQDYGAYGYGTWTALRSFTLNTACYTLTTAINPISGGSLQLPAQNCAGGYTSGTNVRLTIVPAAGYLFLNWSGDASGNANPLDLVMDGNKNLTANLSGVSPIAPAGTLNSWDHSFSWNGASGATWYFLEVQTSTGSELLRKWYTASAVGCSSDLNCILTPAELLGLTNGTYKWRIQDYGAYGYGAWTAFQSFTIDAACYTLTVTDDPIGSSTFSTTTQNCSGGYTAGTVVQLTAIPNQGFVFLNWSGDAVGGINSVSVTMDGNKSVNASLRGVATLAPTGTLNTWDHTFTWTGASGATWYFLDVQKSDGTEVLRKWYTAITASCSSDLSCFLTPAELSSLPDGNYKWRVQDYGPYGYGAWTAFKPFSLIP
jgi:hypothetical protein